MKQTKWIGGFILATFLLVLFPISRARELKGKQEKEQKALYAMAIANEEKNKAEQKVKADAEIAELVKKNNRIADIWGFLLESSVRQPTRPLADVYQLVLEWHYLWLEVRDTNFWRSKPTERADMDAIIIKLVSAANRDKNLRDLMAR
ncbi:MAG: hypothetical protein NTZ94_16900 [Verrucomicrobia bacterium]|nr:hypothetical protein [Verrucomicrobiota bacterium]